MKQIVNKEQRTCIQIWCMKTHKQMRYLRSYMRRLKSTTHIIFDINKCFIIMCFDLCIFILNRKE